MSDWLSIVAVVTGAIGAITGIAGLVLGYKGYRKAQDVKALDLRLELRKAVTDARAIVDDLDGMMADAKVWNDALWSFTGRSGGGHWKLWNKDWEADQKTVGSLRVELGGYDNSDGATNNHAQLESRLVSIHALTTTANRVRNTYKEQIKEDKKFFRRVALRAEREHGR